MLSLLHVLTYLELNVCLISPFFRSPLCRDYILVWIDNYLREYTESTINIIQVLILKVNSVNNLTNLGNIFKLILQAD